MSDLTTHILTEPAKGDNPAVASANGAPGATELPSLFHSLNAASMTERGIEPVQALLKHPNGALSIVALEPGDEEHVYATMYGALSSQAIDEMIFGFDRFGRLFPSREATDFLSVHYYRFSVGWRFGVLAYDHECRSVQPIAWEPAYWGPRLQAETLSHFRAQTVRAREGRAA